MRSALHRTAAWASLLLAGLANGCLDDRTVVAPNDLAVHLALNATIVDAKAGQTVHIRAFYRRVGGTEITLPSSPTSVSVTPGVAKQVAVVVRVADCLGDPQQLGGTTERCAVAIALSLEDETGVLIDEQTTNPTQLSPGSNATLEPIVFTPVAQVTLGALPVLREGDTRTLTATALDGEGKAMPSKAIKWTSDSPGILTVNATTGAATAIAAGSSRVTATAGARNASATVRVIRRVASVLISPDPAPTVLAAAGLTLVPAPKATDGTDAGDLADRVITWTSTNPAGATSTATVTATGIVTGVFPGNADVTVSVDGVTKTVRLRITAANVRITGSTTITVVGNKIPLQATVLDAKDVAIPNVPVTWSSSDPTAATVDANGVVTAVGEGLAIITASGGGVSRTWPMHVTTLRLDVQPKTAQIMVGDEKLLTAENNIGPVTWVSSNPLIASVSTSGVVTGKAPGAVTITGTTNSTFGVQLGTADILVLTPNDSLGVVGLQRQNVRRPDGSTVTKPSPRK